MGNLAEYDGRKLISAETGGINLGNDGGRAESSDTADDAASTKGGDDEPAQDSGDGGSKLSQEEASDFSEWLKTTLSESLQEVKASDRLVDSPAILVDHESAAIMRMMRMADQEHKTGGVKAYTPKQKMEINPGHPIIQQLNKTRNNDPELARLVAEQLYDNATVAAGIMEDPRVMLKNLNAILLKSMDKE